MTHIASLYLCIFELFYVSTSKKSLKRSPFIIPRILDILILQDKTLFGALEASNIVCWLVNQPIAKLDLFKSLGCRWICETYVEYCYRNSATVRRLVQSPTLQSTISCGVHSDSRGKGIRVSPAWLYSMKRSKGLSFPSEGGPKFTIRSIRLRPLYFGNKNLMTSHLVIKNYIHPPTFLSKKLWTPSIFGTPIRRKL